MDVCVTGAHHGDFLSMDATTHSVSLGQARGYPFPPHPLVSSALSFSSSHATMRSLLVVLALPLVLGAQDIGSLPPTIAAELRAAVIDTFKLPQGGSYGDTCVLCANGGAIGALVRVSFHDAAGGGGPDSNGGANGCIDPTNSDNNGLAVITSQLNAIQARFQSYLSRGDLYVFAANIAIELASTRPTGRGLPAGFDATTGPLYLPFRTGRVDDASCNGVDAAFLPLTSFTWAGSPRSIASTFGRFGMSVAEIVALFGAHTVGRLNSVNSGIINGGWTVFQSSFSTSYYKTLVGIPWDKKDRAQADLWTAGPGQVMLRPDVELVLNTTGGSLSQGRGGVVSACDVFNINNIPVPPGAPPVPPAPPGICPAQNATRASVEYFARNQAAWYANFSTAWVKMTEFGYSVTAGVLIPVGPLPLLPSSSPSASPAGAGLSGAALGAAIGVPIAVCSLLAVAACVSASLRANRRAQQKAVVEPRPPVPWQQPQP